MPQLFIDISWLLIVSALLGLLARRFKQPLLLAYIATGFILGPHLLGYLKEPDFLHTLSTFGIALVLFLVGLELNLNKLGSLGKISLFIGFIQVVLTAILGFTLAKFLSYSWLPAIYLGIALTFSSTIVVIKLLSEQQALESLYGRLAVGILVVQDILAIVTLVLLSAFNHNGNHSVGPQFLLMASKGLLFFVGMILVSRWLLQKLFAWLAKSTELLLLSSVAWCLLAAMVSVALGFSLEIGAFMAGLALAPLPYHLEIIGRVRPLRDFFITIFFVALGTQLTFANLGVSWTVIILFILFALLIKPLLVMIIMGTLGYHRRTAFFTSLSLAQISEFSLIIVALGQRLNQINDQLASLVMIVALVSITLSSYLITYSEKIYRLLNPWLKIFQKKQTLTDDITNERWMGHTVVFGYHRLGEKIVATLQKLKQTVLVIDFDPAVIELLKQRNINCFYGDMADLEILDKAGINKAKMIISTVPDIDNNLLLLKDIKKQGVTKPAVYLTANAWHDTKALYEAGADYVIFPHHLSAEHFSLMLQNQVINKDRFLVDKHNHLRELELHYADRNRH